MSQFKKIRRIVTGTATVDGAGVHLVRVLGHADVEDFDPFLMLDAFDSREPSDYVKGFPWHPHRGIETITYLIEGEIEHGDSLGNAGRILSGGCQWMTAGRGIIHQEMPKPAPRMLGLQLWLNLPQRSKLTPPKYLDISPSMIPHHKIGLATIRVISGSYDGVSGPAEGEHVKPQILDLELPPDTTLELPLDPLATAFLYLFEGSASIEGRHVEKHRAVLLGEGDTLALRSGSEGLRALSLAARPLREPIAWGGPIVMNTRDELREAFAQLEQGRFIQEATA